MDQGLGDRIADSIDPQTGIMNSDGYRYQQVQHALRDTMDNVTAADVDGGTAGFQRYQDGRTGYAQVAKMRQLERLQARAQSASDPQAAFQRMVTNMANNRYQSRGWTADELAAAKDAGNRGFIGGAQQVLAAPLGRLTGAGIGGWVGGVPGALVGGEIGKDVTTSMMRGSGLRQLDQRVQGALNTLLRRIPQ
jgi:hypothetical protein